MKHSELRVGNYVMYESELIQITKISVQVEPSGSYPTVASGGIYYYPAYLQPIPITKEWLQKLGFTIEEIWSNKSGSDFFQNDRKIVVSISSYYGNMIHLNQSDGSHNEVGKYIIKYVHELQNIYHYLTGHQL